MQRPMVLIVDDNSDNREIMAVHLENLGYASVDFDCVELALEVLQGAKDNRYEAVISDWMMPGLSGLDLFIKMQNDSNLKKIPVILITARTDTKSQQLATRLGIKYFLSKPFNQTQLLQILNVAFSTGRKWYEWKTSATIKENGKQNANSSCGWWFDIQTNDWSNA